EEGSTEAEEGRSEAQEGSTEAEEGRSEAQESCTEAEEGRSEAQEGCTEAEEGRSEAQEGCTEAEEGRSEAQDGYSQEALIAVCLNGTRLAGSMQTSKSPGVPGLFFACKDGHSRHGPGHERKEEWPRYPGKDTER
ncbi:MAG TPA: hypothetical protein VM011_05850, partial [Gammaproteobacteria bacterium]|nr:hypothetical protein [Gammaproteobacteria bacterium]